MIKVLMIADQVELMKEFVSQAAEDDIIMDLVSSHQEGIEKIASQPFSTYDDIILDADVKTSKDSTDTSLSGLSKSLIYLDKIAYQQGLYPYIFTGQPGKLDQAKFKNLFGRDYYLKGSDEERLIQDIFDDNSNTLNQSIDCEMSVLRDVFETGSLAAKHLNFFYRRFLRFFSLGPFHESDANEIQKSYEALFKDLINHFLMGQDFINRKGQPNFTRLIILFTREYSKKITQKFEYYISSQTKSAVASLDSVSRAYSHQNRETYFGNMIRACAFDFVEFLPNTKT